MKKLLLLFAFALVLPFCFATLTDEPNSISCQVNEVVLTCNYPPCEGGGDGSSFLREDIFQIEEDKYWDIWCYVQDAQNQPVDNALVQLLVDGQLLDESQTNFGWTNFPVPRSMPHVPAFYSTTTPGAGGHLLTATTGTLQYAAPFTVGQATPFDWVTIAIVVVVAIVAVLVYMLVTGKKKR